MLRVVSTGDQVPDSGESSEGRVVSAEGLSETTGFRESSGDDHAVDSDTELESIGHADGDGEHPKFGRGGHDAPEPGVLAGMARHLGAAVLGEGDLGLGTRGGGRGGRRRRWREQVAVGPDGRLQVDVEVDLEVNLKVDLKVDLEVDLEVDFEVDLEVDLQVDLEIDLEVEVDLEVDPGTLGQGYSYRCP